MNDKAQSKKIIATVGVSNGEIQCIAYHFHFKDQNLDAKVSIGEKLWFSQKASWDLQIAYSLAEQGAAYDTELIRSSIKEILRSGAEAAVSATQFAYFQVLIGIPVGQLLTAAGVTGIKKIVYDVAIKSVLKGVVF